MAEYTVNNMLNTPQTMDVTYGGRSFLPPFRLVERHITINRHNYTISQMERVKQQYLKYCYCVVNKDVKNTGRIMLDTIVTAFKPYHRFFTEHWIKKRLPYDMYAAVFAFIIEPAKNEIEESVKNLLALQKKAS
jgi:hypothetical protein